MSIIRITEKNSDGLEIVRTHPYASKSNATHKFFKRIHGAYNSSIANTATGNIEFVVPYNQAKIAKIELFNCSFGDTCNVKFLDTPTGTISTVPNYMLNQFGFNTELPDGTYKSKSEYDADVIKDMKIVIEYTNNSGSAKRVGMNIHLDEMVPL